MTTQVLWRAANFILVSFEFCTMLLKANIYGLQRKVNHFIRTILYFTELTDLAGRLEIWKIFKYISCGRSKITNIFIKMKKKP